jgi:hypothetical protein
MQKGIKKDKAKSFKKKPIAGKDTQAEVNDERFTEVYNDPRFMRVP